MSEKMFICDAKNETCLNCPLVDCIRENGTGKYPLDGTKEIISVRVVKIVKDRRIYQREYHHEYNKTEKRKEYHRKYYKKNRERIINKQLEYYYKNKEEAV